MAEYPSDWTVERLGVVVDINPTSNMPLPDEFIYVDLESVKSGKLVSRNLCVRCSAPSRAQRHFERGDVLFQTVRPYQCNNLMVDFDSRKYIASTGYAVLHEKKGISCSTFVYQCVHQDAFVKEVLNRCTGTSYPAISPAKLGEICIPLPPLPEQQRIAQVLGDTDRLIVNLGRRIAKKKLIKKGAMQELLTGEKRLPGFDGEWKQFRLKELGQIFKGAGISRAESNSGDLPAVRYGEIYTHHNDYVKTYVSRISPAVAVRSQITRRGDVLFTGSGETFEEIGKCVAVVDDGVYAGGDTIVFSPYEETDPKFFGYLLNMPYIQVQKSNAGHGATIVHIRPEDIASLLVKVPEVNEQKSISHVLSNMDAEIANLERQQAKLKLVKRGMLQDLLSGKVRLV